MFSKVWSVPPSALFQIRIAGNTFKICVPRSPLVYWCWGGPRNLNCGPAPSKRYFNAFCSLGLLSRRKMCVHSLIHPTLIMHLSGRPWATCLSSVQFSCSVVPDSLWAHGLQHARPPCPSPTPRVYANLCSLSWWCHPTLSSSVIPFSSCLQSFPASGSFQKSQFFASGGQMYWSFSFSISPTNEYSRLISFRMDCLDLLAVQGTLKSLLQHQSSKASIFLC